MEHKVVTDYSEGVGLNEDSNVKVFVRVRPPEGSAEMPPLMFSRDTDSAASRKITIRVRLIVYANRSRFQACACRIRRPPTRASTPLPLTACFGLKPPKLNCSNPLLLLPLTTVLMVTTPAASRTVRRALERRTRCLGRAVIIGASSLVQVRFPFLIFVV